MFRNLVLVLAMIAAAPAAHALDIGERSYHDGRVKYFTYEEDEVYRIGVHFGFVTSIRFEKGEHVESVQVGDGVSYKIEPLKRGDLLSIVPLEEERRVPTNMIVTTRGRNGTRLYVFDIAAGHATSGTDTTYLYRFHYPAPPPDAARDIAKADGAADVVAVAQANGRDLNFSYRADGDDLMTPDMMFDDGQKTYLRFKPLSPVPAVFAVGQDRSEASVNTSVLPDGTLVVHTVRPRFTLRGRDGVVVCIYNGALQERDASNIDILSAMEALYDRSKS